MGCCSPWWGQGSGPPQHWQAPHQVCPPVTRRHQRSRPSPHRQCCVWPLQASVKARPLHPTAWWLCEGKTKVPGRPLLLHRLIGLCRALATHDQVSSQPPQVNGASNGTSRAPRISSDHVLSSISLSELVPRDDAGAPGRNLLLNTWGGALSPALMASGCPDSPC